MDKFGLITFSERQVSCQVAQLCYSVRPNYSKPRKAALASMGHQHYLGTKVIKSTDQRQKLGIVLDNN